jgi:hypothetical protein
VPGIVLQGFQGVEIACICQFVEIEDGLVRLSQPVQYKIGSDEACAACYENHALLQMRGRRIINPSFYKSFA